MNLGIWSHLQLPLPFLGTIPHYFLSCACPGSGTDTWRFLCAESQSQALDALKVFTHPALWVSFVYGSTTLTSQ
jgi:hypothetical protein